MFITTKFGTKLTVNVIHSSNIQLFLDAMYNTLNQIFIRKTRGNKTLYLYY